MAFVGGLVRNLAQDDGFLVARDFQDHGVPLVDALFGLGGLVGQTWARDRHAFDQLGVLYVEGQRRRMRLDGAGDRRRRRWGARLPVLPVRAVILRPGIPEPDHGFGGVVVDRPAEGVAALVAGRLQWRAQFHRFLGRVDAGHDGARFDGIRFSGIRVPFDHVADLDGSELQRLRG